MKHKYTTFHRGGLAIVSYSYKYVKTSNLGLFFHLAVVIPDVKLGLGEKILEGSSKPKLLINSAIINRVLDI